MYQRCYGKFFGRSVVFFERFGSDVTFVEMLRRTKQEVIRGDRGKLSARAYEHATSHAKLWRNPECHDDSNGIH